MDVSKKVIDEIFGIQKAPATLDGMKVLFKSGGFDRTKEQVCQDVDGCCHLTVEPTKEGYWSRLGMGTYEISEKITMPISRLAARSWADFHLCGDDLLSATEMFGDYPPDVLHAVWESHRATGAGLPDTHEWLMVSDAGDYVLYSTDDSYPFSHGSTTFTQFSESESDELACNVYIYYIPEETARRWADANGIDADAWAASFCAAESLPDTTAAN